MRKILSAVLALALLLAAGCAARGENGALSEGTVSQSASGSDEAENTEIPEPEQENPLTDAGVLDFVFSSGAGAWSTQLTLLPDGTFTGRYQDMDMGDMGEENPNGTVYYCDFSGSFFQPGKVDDHFWTMSLEYLSTEKEPGEITYEDGVKYVSTGPNGLEQAQEVWLYLPGAGTEDLPEEFMSWTTSAFAGEVPEELPFYGLYSVNDQSGFVGYPAEENAQGQPQP